MPPGRNQNPVGDWARAVLVELDANSTRHSTKIYPHGKSADMQGSYAVCGVSCEIWVCDMWRVVRTLHLLPTSCVC